VLPVVDLLKGTLPNALTVGAVEPRNWPTDTACRFTKVLHTTDLALKYDDEDMRHLIEYWMSKEVTRPAMVEYVSEYVLGHCGGHVYPLLASMEYIFTDPEAIKALAEGKVQFLTHYLTVFVKSATYRALCDSCFDGPSVETDAGLTLVRVLGGSRESSDALTLTLAGVVGHGGARRPFSPAGRGRLQPHGACHCGARTHAASVVKAASCTRASIRESVTVKKPAGAKRGYCTGRLAVGTPATAAVRSLPAVPGPHGAF
jgi:hypothetical protein